MRPFQKNTVVLIALLLSVVSLTYLNHFRNSFHFDDSHTVENNPYIRTIANLPLFFTDARTFSVLPRNRSYRPVVTLSLAIDYWLGNGLNPVYFQASTFFWFLLQLVLMYALFRNICDIARPDSRNRWIALLAAAVYGLHPAIAETVNYVIRGGDDTFILQSWRDFGLLLWRDSTTGCAAILSDIFHSDSSQRRQRSNARKPCPGTGRMAWVCFCIWAGRAGCFVFQKA